MYNLKYLTEYHIPDILPEVNASKYWWLMLPKFGDGRVAGLAFEPVIAEHLGLEHTNEKFVDFRSKTERLFPIEMKGRTKSGIDFKASNTKGAARKFDRDHWNEHAIERDWIVADVTRVIEENRLYFMILPGQHVFTLGPSLNKKESAALFAKKHPEACEITCW